MSSPPPLPPAHLHLRLLRLERLDVVEERQRLLHVPLRSHLLGARQLRPDLLAKLVDQLRLRGHAPRRGRHAAGQPGSGSQPSRHTQHRGPTGRNRHQLHASDKSHVNSDAYKYSANTYIILNHKTSSISDLRNKLFATRLRTCCINLIKTKCCICHSARC